MAETLSGSMNKLKREALANWRRWAQAMADGGKPPAVMELLEAGAVLQVREPIPELEADANALLENRDLEQRAEWLREAARQATAPYGGAAGVRARIGELRRELQKLEGLVGPHQHAIAAGRLSGDATRLRAKHPRVFGVADAKPTKSKRATQEADL